MRHLTMILLFLIHACAVKKTAAPIASPLETADKEQKKQVALTSLDSLDPNNAKILIQSLSVMASQFGEEFKMPSIQMELSGADYVQILRCQKKYRPIYDQLRSNREDSQEEKKWLWLDSLGQSHMCQIASKRFSASLFQDITAQSGDFFYILNPCLSAASSKLGKDSCSYLIALTEDVAFSSSISMAFQAKAFELSEAEARYEHLTGQVRLLAKELSDHKKTCDEDLQRQKKKEDLASLNQVFGIIASATLMGSGFLGVRSLLRASKNDKNSLLRPSKNEVMGTIGVISAAASLALILQKILSTSQENLPSCLQMESIASQISAFQEDHALERAGTELEKISAEMQQLNSKFQGYEP